SARRGAGGGGRRPGGAAAAREAGAPAEVARAAAGAAGPGPLPGARRGAAAAARLAGPRVSGRPADAGIHRRPARAAGLARRAPRGGAARRAAGAQRRLPPLPRERHMTWVLTRKLLRAVRWPLLAVALFLGGYQCLWAKLTERVLGRLSPFFRTLAGMAGLTPKDVEQAIFEGPGQVFRTLIGGERVVLENAMDVLSIGYVHPLMQVVF